VSEDLLGQTEAGERAKLPTLLDGVSGGKSDGVEQ